MYFIDSHAHIYQEEILNDLSSFVFRSQANDVQQIIMPCVDSQCLQNMYKCEELFPTICFSTVGLHPCYVNTDFSNELSLLKQELEHKKFYAIGEIGIDLYHDTTFKNQQEIVFVEQIKWALEYDLPIIIHTRNAFYDTVRCLKSVQKKGFKGVFHCFGGSLQDAEVALEMGFKLGIGGVVTYKNSTLPSIIKDIDLENIILETDSPYLTPVPFRGKPNEPSYIPYIAQKIAEIKNISVDNVANVTSKVCKELFKLPEVC
ncbi:MAG: TatD family hydrolase [Cytophagales bacterium]